MKKICIAGKNNIAVEIAKYLKEKYDIEILAIPNSTDNGIDGWQKSFYKFCLENSIPIISLEEAHKIENLIFLSLEFDKIVKPYEFLSDKLFNIHFSLLPKYKGMYTSALPILNNEKETGVTLHKIDTGIDTGEIIAQRKIKIEFDDTSRDLYLKYIANGIELIKENISNILNNTIVTYPQNNLESSYFSKKSIDYKNLKININQTALNIHNQIRAFNFREYQLPKIHDKKIISTLTTNQKSLRKPGTILFETDNEILMSTIDYNIILYKDRTDELFKACCTGDIILVQEICKNKEYLKVRNDKGWDPLIVAVYNNNIEVVKYLISLGANIYTENYNGTNLIMYAKDCYLNTKDSTLLELFISLGLDIYKKDFKNKNVLDYCSDELKERIIKYETNQKINGGGVQL